MPRGPRDAGLGRLVVLGGRVAASDARFIADVASEQGLSVAGVVRLLCEQARQNRSVTVTDVVAGWGDAGSDPAGDIGSAVRSMRANAGGHWPIAGLNVPPDEVRRRLDLPADGNITAQEVRTSDHFDEQAPMLRGGVRYFAAPTGASELQGLTPHASWLDETEAAATAALLDANIAETDEAARIWAAQHPDRPFTPHSSAEMAAMQAQRNVALGDPAPRRRRRTPEQAAADRAATRQRIANQTIAHLD